MNHIKSSDQNFLVGWYRASIRGHRIELTQLQTMNLKLSAVAALWEEAGRGPVSEHRGRSPFTACLWAEGDFLVEAEWLTHVVSFDSDHSASKEQTGFPALHI